MWQAAVWQAAVETEVTRATEASFRAAASPDAISIDGAQRRAREKFLATNATREGAPRTRQATAQPTTADEANGEANGKDRATMWRRPEISGHRCRRREANGDGGKRRWAAEVRRSGEGERGKGG